MESHKRYKLFAGILHVAFSMTKKNWCQTNIHAVASIVLDCHVKETTSRQRPGIRRKLTTVSKELDYADDINLPFIEVWITFKGENSQIKQQSREQCTYW